MRCIYQRALPEPSNCTSCRRTSRHSIFNTSCILLVVVTLAAYHVITTHSLQQQVQQQQVEFKGDAQQQQGVAQQQQGVAQQRGVAQQQQGVAQQQEAAEPDIVAADKVEVVIVPRTHLPLTTTSSPSTERHTPTEAARRRDPKAKQGKQSSGKQSSGKKSKNKKQNKGDKKKSGDTSTVTLTHCESIPVERNTMVCKDKLGEDNTLIHRVVTGVQVDDTYTLIEVKCCEIKILVPDS